MTETTHLEKRIGKDASDPWLARYGMPSGSSFIAGARLIEEIDERPVAGVDMFKQFSAALLLAIAGCHEAPLARIEPLVDYHVHLLGPYALPVEPSIADRYPPGPVTADKLIASMDKAGIRRGLVLSTVPGVPGSEFPVDGRDEILRGVPRHRGSASFSPHIKPSMM